MIHISILKFYIHQYKSNKLQGNLSKLYREMNKLHSDQYLYYFKKINNNLLRKSYNICGKNIFCTIQDKRDKEKKRDDSRLYISYISRYHFQSILYNYYHLCDKQDIQNPPLLVDMGILRKYALWRKHRRSHIFHFLKYILQCI